MTKRRKKGFGLLEVLLAGVIIIMMMSALVIVARAAIQNSQYLQQRSQATFLAQEGIELVRQMRDTNYLDGDNSTKWDTLFAADTDTLCQSKPTERIKDRVGQGFPITWISSLSRYDLCNGTGDITMLDGVEYSRYIVFQYKGNLVTNPTIDAPDSIYKVESIVEWSYQGENKTVEIDELFANSRQGF